LDQHIEEEVEKNIALETDEPADPADGLVIELPGRLLSPQSKTAPAEEPEPPSSIPLDLSTSHQEKLFSDETEDFYGPYNYKPSQSLYEQLIEQLASWELHDWERNIVEFIIYNLTPEGFLSAPIEKLARLYTYQGLGTVALSDWERLLTTVVQKLDPPGIGARTTIEALKLQIEALDPNEEPLQPLLLRLIRDYSDLLQEAQFQRIRRRLNIDEETWRQLLRRLSSLDLRPGLSASEEVPATISPDFLLHIEDNMLRVEVLYYKPRKLRIRRQYLELLEKLSKQKDPELRQTYEELKKRVEAAKQFMEHLMQRERTLRLTVEEIVRQQKAFFLGGCDDKLLRPMILEDVAKAVGLDISTISRVANSKYIQTPCGIYALKHFFSEGLPTKGGQEVSNKAVWGLMKELIASEDPDKPYSDEALVKLLQERGIQIQRRTVAKYRQQLGIPASSERRLHYKLR
jgi:RNA polymerase sigma-54 factor